MKNRKLTEQQAALLGALEMLTQIAQGKSFSAIEFHSRLVSYKTTLLHSAPQLASDAYYGKLFQ